MEVELSDAEEGRSLPLIIKPKDGQNSAEFLQNWVKENASWLREKMLQHGAILFRGFKVHQGIEFQQIVQEFEPHLSNEYRGSSPRKLISGTQFVFSASELPPHVPIPQHLEMSFLPAPPRSIFFCCLEPPTSVGGETTLCDFKKVYDEMDPHIRQEFEDKGVTCIRNYIGKKTLLTDPTMLKGWQDVFDTDDKEIVEQECRKTEVEYQWKKNDGLRLMTTEAAVEEHPDTGDKIWFNHTSTFHWSMVPDEYYRIYKRTGWIRYYLLSWAAWLAKFLLFYFLGPMNVGFHTKFGDGSEIPERYQSHLRDILWRNMVFNRWELGDLVMIDNFRISHGRQPFRGKRKVVVAWSRPTPKPSVQKRKSTQPRTINVQ